MFRMNGNVLRLAQHTQKTMIKPGQLINVQIWGQIKVGRAVCIENGEITVDFPVFGGLFRLTVPAKWCTVYVMKGGKIT